MSKDSFNEMPTPSKSECIRALDTLSFQVVDGHLEQWEANVAIDNLQSLTGGKISPEEWEEMIKEACWNGKVYRLMTD